MTEERRVLIIDDCPEDRETYRRYLLQDSDYTYIVLEEETGEKGLELCRLLKPDSVLLDYLLPDLDGLEFLNELRNKAGKVDIPVVMVTGYGNEAVAVQAMKSGAADYLVKGHTTPESLRIALRHAMENMELIKKLAWSEERFRTSVENMLDCFGIYSAIRDASGRIVDFRIEYVNEAACADNQMSREEQLGRGLCELLPVYREIGWFDEYCRVVETGQPLIKESLIYDDVYNQQKLIKAFDIRVTKLDDGFAAAWRDISERKQMEEELAALMAREQAARAEAESANRKKDEFLAMVSHELRSPLQSILGWTQLLQTRKFDRVTTDLALETIKRSVKLQNQLIQDLMDISRIIRGQLHLDVRPIDLVPAIEATISMVLPAADAKSIKIESLLDSSIGQVLGDSSRLQQVVWNLLSNAIKFTPEGGCITIRLERVESYAQIQVSDTGQGIRADFLPYVFEQFRQADSPSTRVHTGLGLGLAIVRRLVELHNGTVQAASEGEGQGATFTVKLPLESKVLTKANS